MHVKKINTVITAISTAAITTEATLGFAAGLQKVEDSVNNIQATLETIGLAVVTIAFIWAGYKWLFKHSSISELMPVIGGALLIGGATEFATFFVN